MNGVGMSIIPMVETIPPGYRRQFILFTPFGRQDIFVTSEHGMVCWFFTGQDPFPNDSLDWIQESVELIRAELQELAE